MWHVLTWHDDLSWSYVKLSCFSIFLRKDMLWFELVCCGVISDNVICKDLSWYDVTATGDFASRMTEDLNKMQDGMGEKVIIQHISLQRLSNHTLKVGMLFRFIATGIGGFVYPFTQVEKQRWQSVELFLPLLLSHNFSLRIFPLSELASLPRPSHCGASNGSDGRNHWKDHDGCSQGWDGHLWKGDQNIVQILLWHKKPQ